MSTTKALGRKVEKYMEAVASIRKRARTNVQVIATGGLDERLVRSIATGSQASLAEAYRLHGPAVFASAFAATGRRELAEDVVQEVFVRLWNRPERYNPSRGSLRGFLKVDARGRAIDALRSERARRDREDRDARLQTSNTFAGIEEEVMQNVISERVRDVLDELRPEERAPLALAYFEGHSYREVARMLDLPEGTVKSRIRSGLGRLKGILATAGIETT